MATAPVPAVRRAETGDEYAACRGLIKLALWQAKLIYLYDFGIRRGRQVINVPAQFLFPAQMPSNTRPHIFSGAAGIDVYTCRKIKGPQSADGQSVVVLEPDAELIGVCRHCQWCHNSCRASGRSAMAASPT